MNFLKNLIGITEKEQHRKAQEIESYVDKKKEDYKESMKHLKKQGDVLKHKYAKLGVVVDDVVNKIYEVTREQDAHK